MFWDSGEKGRLAEAAGIRPDRLSNILHRREGCSWRYAEMLESASRTVLGDDRSIPAADWVWNRTTEHPAFGEGGYLDD